MMETNQFNKSNQQFLSKMTMGTYRKGTLGQQQSNEEIVASLYRTFSSGRTLPIKFRLTQLKALLRLYEENNSQILRALYSDMRKSELEGYLYEVDLMKNEVRNAIRNLAKWTKDVVIPRNLLTIADVAYYVKQPYGVVLIMGTWNYPFQLTLVPLTGAIAAGNCVLIKPSEISSHSAQLMAELIPKYLDPECYKVLVTGPTESQQLLRNNQFDYIFYTGSLNVGRKVHLAANQHLTPVTLEMGGKSPVYVDSSCNLYMTAQRLMWGKCMNMGQTCVAPDFVLCTKEVQDILMKYCRQTMNEWYNSKQNGGWMKRAVTSANPSEAELLAEQNEWKKAKDLARIINRTQFQRLVKMLQNTQGRIALGGDYDEDDLWIAPTCVADIPIDSCLKGTEPLMLEEIFGPILPFIPVESMEDAIKFIRIFQGNKSKPLCMYVFSNSRAVQLKFQNETQSGTMAFNDTIIQFVIDELPFGGIGTSGMGSYHGEWTFNTFTHFKSIVRRDFSLLGDKVGMFRYPPYTEAKINFLSFLLCHWKKFKIVDFSEMWSVTHFVAIVIGVFLAYLYSILV